MNEIILDIGDWLARQPEFKSVIIEGVKFPIASLSEEIKGKFLIVKRLPKCSIWQQTTPLRTAESD